MNSDTLSDVLQGVRLTGAIFFELRARAPWVETSAEGSTVAPQLLPGVQHSISYHVIAEGRCWVTAKDIAPIQLEAGDIIIFPHGDAHTLSSAPGLTAKANPAIYKEAAASSSLPVSYAFGGSGESTLIVCGILGCDVRPFNPLIATLPRVLHIRDRAGSTRGWLNQFVHVAVAESRDRRPGAQSILARLSELMFVEAVRRHLETLPVEETGWLAGVRDPAVGRALAAIHRQPAHGWSLEDLAREAGASRSALADRFALLVGRPPMQYLMQWRMQLAAGLLARGAKVTHVAFDVGYESEAAFSRAFKKLTGHSPGTWRDRNDRSTLRSRPRGDEGVRVSARWTKVARPA
ncbi:MAG TPA: AraC family transcriptional regulator [Opitutaceae bacterium]|nr:AraC family transcriptional regulator [Opitutaceae bacterium]